MNLGEIIVESLRLMNASDENLSVDNIKNYKQDERFRDYLDRMPGAINRAISRFMTYKVIPTKIAEVKPSQGYTMKQFLKLDLKKILPDFGSLERVIYIYERVVPNIEYQALGDGIILIPFSSSYDFKGIAQEKPNNPTVGDAYNINGKGVYWNGEIWEELKEDEIFNIEYVPNLEMINSTSDNELELPLPETLIRIIPYYVKAELYEIEEPQLSANARNIFESALTEYVSFGITRKQRQQYVKNTIL